MAEISESYDELIKKNQFIQSMSRNNNIVTNNIHCKTKQQSTEIKNIFKIQGVTKIINFNY